MTSGVCLIYGYGLHIKSLLNRESTFVKTGEAVGSLEELAAAKGLLLKFVHWQRVTEGGKGFGTHI